jgi:hypothetical protein
LSFIKGSIALEAYSIATISKDAILDGNIAALGASFDAVVTWKLLGTSRKTQRISATISGGYY